MKRQKILTTILTLIAVLLPGVINAAETIETDTVTFRVNFPVGSSVVNPQFGSNAATLANLSAFHEYIADNPDCEILSIIFHGSVSPEGPYKVNQRLARERVQSLQKYLDASLAPSGNVYITYDEGRPSDSVEAQMVVSKPDVKAYPALRFAEAKFVITCPRPEPAVVEEPVVEPEPIEVVEVEEIESIEVIEEPAVVVEEEPVAPCDHLLMIKTNVIGWGMLISNFAVEYQITPKWSVTLPAYYSGINFFNKRTKFRTFTLQPEARYWINGCNGWFVGAHLGMGWFNYALHGKYRYQDTGGHSPALGGGVSTGFRYNLTRDGKWRFEAHIGVGAYRVKCDKFLNVPNGELIESGIRRTWFGIDNAAVSFIYTINIDRKK